MLLQASLLLLLHPAPSEVVPVPGPGSQGLEGQEFPVAMGDLYEDYRWEDSSPTRSSGGVMARTARRTPPS